MALKRVGLVVFFVVTVACLHVNGQQFSMADTALILYLNQYQKVVVKTVTRKKVEVITPDGQSLVIKPKYLFKPYPEPFNVKCRHFDAVAAADVIVDASALGYNAQNTLVKITYNHQTFAAIKHKSQMAKPITFTK
jgi:ABC-type uncharacterized transport system permease subunit